MSAAVVLILYVLTILVVVLVHEAAHFTAAKAFGIKVQEFFVGFGPRIWSTRRGETEYGLKALPVGGYVRIAGMNPFEEVAPEDMPRTFGAKPAWQRAIVIAAGPFTHFVLAFLVLVLWFGVIGVPSKFEPVIAEVTPRLNGEPSPAAEAGLRAGDVVLAVDGREGISNEELVQYTRDHVGEPIELRVRRGERTLTFTLVPELSDVEGERVGRIGVVLSAGRVLERDRSGPVEAVGDGARAFWQTSSAVVGNFGRVFDIGRVIDLLFGDAQRSPDDPASVVGGGQIAVEAAEAGELDVLIGLFVGFNIFVGLLNLLPIPPFDGGHLAVIAVEKITRKRLDARKLVPITAVVAVFLLLYMSLLILLDIVKPIPDLFP